MKTKKSVIKNIIYIIIAAILVAVGIYCMILNDKKNKAGQMRSYVQSLNYTESTDKINNPDQGFYRPISVRATPEGITYNKAIINNETQVYHLRVDISQFSGAVNSEAQDKLLTTEVLGGLDELLVYLQQNGKNAIIRLAYDPSFNGSANTEPNPLIIYEHIKQVCPILNKYPTTITAIEAGLIGPWGEMHTSSIANATYINQIIQTYLDNTNNLAILVRTPKMIYNYLGITIDDIDNYAIDSSTSAYRLGIYNDGYLGSDTDLGTYTNRLKEIEFISKQTSHLPFGGEVVTPSSNLHNIDTCLEEMFKIHLSYLNVEWNNEVISKWKSTYYTNECGNDKLYYGQTAFDYIQNHMGYRYVLTKSEFEYSTKFDKLNITLSIDNVGFGNQNKASHAKLIFVDENGEINFTKQVADFCGQSTICYSTDLNLDNGNYQVYLCLYAQELDGNPNYCLQFANCDIYNSELCANKIGEIKINK